MATATQYKCKECGDYGPRGQGLCHNCATVEKLREFDLLRGREILAEGYRNLVQRICEKVKCPYCDSTAVTGNPWNKRWVHDKNCPLRSAEKIAYIEEN